ncbi:ribonuclease H-like domain-containing protein [Rhizophagus clarus]|uniref:Ribonuclease H-like domain-containing protein n=1 Tax=Rhizophagus clarus TaxID=94130 RepID=A0A8H3QFZ6_9GLOM|nr:ribonuclease H-like domain-containing protein [Rhizophagus clarus]
MVVSYYNRLSIPPDLSSSPFAVDDASPDSPLSRDSPGLPLPVLLPPGSHYRAEAATLYAALCVTPEDSVVSIYTDSQAAIDGLRSCASSTFTNSRFYYKITNFELWAAIECCIHAKCLSVLPVKVKGHDGDYWNNFADSLANSAHQSDEAFLLPEANITSAHAVRLVYADITCESNPRRFFKTYFQATYMHDLLALKRFQFTLCLTDRDDYIVDWDLTWFTLNYSLTHDASFKACHASRHFTFKFKVFLDDLPLLEKRSDAPHPLL